MAETREFQAEVKQLLHLMIHSLYSNKEIFLRELISNASDATDKLRYEGLKNPDLLDGDSDYRVEVDVNKDTRELIIRDNGIGMNEQEVIDNLGTIANSGTRKYLDSLSGDEKKDSQMIGQFGVGFYSSFIVADKVTVKTRRAGEEQGICWVSEGEGDYSLEPIEKASRGTEIILHLRKDEDEFLETHRLHHVIHKYSEHLSLPVRLQKPAEGDEAEAGYDVVNQGTALWARAKGEIKDEEYVDLYRQLAYDQDEPLTWSHNKVEGNLEYASLLYIPSKAPFDIWDRDSRRGLKLYVQRVFIMEDADKLLPGYLRFVRGVIDSNDLPLNVSRELLQADGVIEKIRAASVKRVLSMLAAMAKKDLEKYTQFYDAFGPVIKEGVVEDADNREKILELLRFSSTKTEGDQRISLKDYVERMPEGQNEIYFLTAENLTMAKASPHLEAFAKRDVEVLLLLDRVDEWMVNSIPEFDGRKLKSVVRGDIDLSEMIEDPEAEGEKARVEALYKDILERLQTLLAGKVETVRLSQRLTESPSCLVVGDQAMSRHFEQLLRQAGESIPSSQPILEVNAEHPLLQRLKDTSDDEGFSDLGHLLFEQAVLAEGSQLDDPASFVKRLNRLVFKA
ncbi:MAG: molecular chaperone HtpG [Oceanococcus sp.]